MSRRFPVYAAFTTLTALTVTAVLIIGAGSASAKSRLDGSLSVTNDRRAPVSIRIDGTPRGSIPGLTTVRLRDVPNGVRVVKVRGPRGGVAVHELKVRPRKHATLRIAPIFAKARVLNRVGVSMRVAIDGRFIGTVSNGSSLVTGPMRGGSYRLTATPLGVAPGHSARLQRTLTITPGGKNVMKLSNYLSSLKVTNPFGGRARLLIDGRSQGKLNSGDSVLVSGLLPGVHKLSFRRRGRTLSTNSITLAMGSKRAFTPALPTGQLRVSNQRRRSVSIAINGRNVGTLAPGQSRVFSGLPLGQVTVQARSSRKVKTLTARISRRSMASLNIGRGQGAHRTASF